MAWIKFESFLNEDWADYKFINVDTRDFHCIGDSEIHAINFEDFYKNISKPKWEKLKDKFLLKEVELREMLTRFKRQSGGEQEWRMFRLKGEGEKHSLTWQLKYLRILRFEENFLICSSYMTPLSKNVLKNDAYDNKWG